MRGENLAQLASDLDMTDGTRCYSFNISKVVGSAPEG